jgi:four helix bundle protein
MDELLLNRNKNINRGFRKLDIWKISIHLYKLTYCILSKHQDIPFKVKAQIEDASLSISSNIAEGYSRRTAKENLRFYEIALSSSAELYSQMFALCSTAQISSEDFTEFDTLSYELENKLIKMNQTLVSNLQSKGEWNSDYGSNHK